MKILFIPAYSKIDIFEVIKKIKKAKLKGKIGLITTIQFLPQLKKAKRLLENSIIGGQITGCNINNALKIKNKINSYLYIGSGIFHPIEVAIKTKKPVYIANPLTNEISQITQEQIQKEQKRRKGLYIKFLSAQKIGIIISTKSGQYNLKEALKIKNKIKKQSYLFISNTINTEELENFPQIGCWINTACLRIEGKNIINYKEILG